MQQNAIHPPHIISTCKIARTVALSNSIAPYVSNRNEKTKSSLVKN